ncbi:MULTISPECIES: cation:proton antiporter regulatory subunit [Priestia]|jgi:TrkA domain protein|uniref:cation:proton antiporter regulatory subunit n=1 Tax=Priestia TaxID=2800373 RepID=UPI000BFD9353|nr:MULTISPECIES: cation:proton antiporter regulatory subunit [Priestia]MDR7243911.1 TrkA domain protein [Priestia megaterium]PGR08783.1 potassium:proton antiporter [Priestia megaterium]QTL49085.1 cation:proton antiporter regulatory subunit [Priestia aryabhattai]USL42044.1 cation:proton antiporter regulatory subunit [Priestia megaterium]
MMIKETELPGIGRKFEIETSGGNRVVVIIHDDGRREIYHFNQKDLEESIFDITLTDTESRQLAAILGGMIYKPKAMETIEVAFNDLVIEWYKVEKQAKAHSKTIGEIDVRSNYDVTIIAVIKNTQKKLSTPGPDTLIEEGDTLVISGERGNLKTLIKELLSQGGSS